MQGGFDLEEFACRNQQVLMPYIQDKQFLRKSILDIPKQKHLFELCEHYDILDKIVLFVSEDKSLRIRLHIFADGYFDRPHNHRWSYSSYILSGGYRHIIYVLKEEQDHPTVKDLLPSIIRQEKAGDFYTLYSAQFHSVTAEPNTVSLIARGPADKDRFRLIDRVTNEAWWQYGASTENPEEKKKKEMSKDHFNAAIAKLEKLGII